MVGYMASNEHEPYPQYGLGWRHFQDADPRKTSWASLAATLGDAIRKHPNSALAALLIVGAVAINANRFFPGQTGGEQQAATSISTERDEEITPYFTTSDLIKMAQQLLETPGLDMNTLSVKEQMQEGGYSLEQFITWGTVARNGTAGEDGLFLRRVPSSDNEQFPSIDTIQYRTRLWWNAEIPVTCPDGSIDTFGLLDSPQITKTLIRPQAPNVLAIGNVYFQIEPRYVRLWRQNPDKSITPFVQSEVIPQTLPDGSLDLGNGAIGSSTDDQNYSK